LQSGDPLEGDLQPDGQWLIGKLLDLLGDQFKELERWLRRNASEDEMRDYTANCMDGPYVSQFLTRLYIRELAKRRAVWCWFESETESAGMWSIYGHKGVAVRTTLGDLQQALPADRDFQIAQMRYAGREPQCT
jgi:hypothetical protein